MTTGQTLLYGLIGDPVSHSLSPFIMNRAFRQLGLDAAYVAFGVKPEMLDASMGGLTTMGTMGLNVTYPFKEEILYYLDVVSSDADLVQAVNTLVLDEDGVTGYNTDAPGTAGALEFFADIVLEDVEAFIFGVGGSARAAAHGLLERGAQRVTFGVRSQDKAEFVIDRFSYAFPEQTIDFVLLENDDQRGRRRESFRDAGVVINATPVGMAGGPDDVLIVSPEWIHGGQCFFDFVYHPRQTAFLATAQQAGAKTLGGLALLVSQAVESFRIWTDETFDVKEMVEAVELFHKPVVRRDEG